MTRVRVNKIAWVATARVQRTKRSGSRSLQGTKQVRTRTKGLSTLIPRCRTTLQLIIFSRLRIALNGRLLLWSICLPSQWLFGSRFQSRGSCFLNRWHMLSRRARYPGLSQYTVLETDLVSIWPRKFMELSRLEQRSLWLSSALSLVAYSMLWQGVLPTMLRIRHRLFWDNYAQLGCSWESPMAWSIWHSKLTLVKCFQKKRTTRFSWIWAELWSLVRHALSSFLSFALFVISRSDSSMWPGSLLLEFCYRSSLWFNLLPHSWCLKRSRSRGDAYRSTQTTLTLITLDWRPISPRSRMKEERLNLFRLLTKGDISLWQESISLTYWCQTTQTCTIRCSWAPRTHHYLQDHQ